MLPTQTVLEIAPGFGRWTPYLIASSQHYIGIDISERCVSHCRRTFGPLAGRPKFLVGTGMDLAGVATEGVSLAFSFDSLVHAEADCLAAYAKELFRVLEPGGHAFLHHSNFGEYVVDGQLSIPLVGWRGRTVTAEWARDTFKGCGFQSIAHEKITWVFDQIYSDCFTLVRKPDPDRHCRPLPAETVFYNDKFSEELATARLVSARYTKPLSDRYGQQYRSRGRRETAEHEAACYLAPPRLSDLFRKWATDKGVNGYSGLYECLFHRHRLRVQSLLEIGIGTMIPGALSSMVGFAQPGYSPGGSLKVWREYFPNAFIYGMDIQPDTQFDDEVRIATILCDSRDADQVSRTLRYSPHKSFDVIIDDGSHWCTDQLATLANLFPY